jgi:hypothetical protein
MRRVSLRNVRRHAKLRLPFSLPSPSQASPGDRRTNLTDMWVVIYKNVAMTRPYPGARVRRRSDVVEPSRCCTLTPPPPRPHSCTRARTHTCTHTHLHTSHGPLRSFTLTLGCSWSLQVGSPFKIKASTGTLSQGAFNWVSIDLTGHAFGRLAPSTPYWVALVPGATYSVPTGSIGELRCLSRLCAHVVRPPRPDALSCTPS